MKLLNIPSKLLKVIPAMGMSDWFCLPDGRKFKLVVRATMYRPVKVEVLTFECDGKYYKCNVWNTGEVFYLQEM